MSFGRIGGGFGLVTAASPRSQMRLFNGVYGDAMVRPIGDSADVGAILKEIEKLRADAQSMLVAMRTKDAKALLAKAKELENRLMSSKAYKDWMSKSKGRGFVLQSTGDAEAANVAGEDATKPKFACSWKCKAIVGAGALLLGFGIYKAVT